MAKKTVEEARPTNDAYTGMLAISLIALTVGGVLLYLDFSQYGPEPPPAVPTAVPAVVQQPVAPVQPAQPPAADPNAPAPMPMPQPPAAAP